MGGGFGGWLDGSGPSCAPCALPGLAAVHPGGCQQEKQQAGCVVQPASATVGGMPQVFACHAGPPHTAKHMEGRAAGAARAYAAAAKASAYPTAVASIGRPSQGRHQPVGALGGPPAAPPSGFSCLQRGTAPPRPPAPAGVGAGRGVRPCVTSRNGSWCRAWVRLSWYARGRGQWGWTDAA